MKKDYLIDYILYSTDNAILKQGKMRVKNKYSSLEAQVKLEEFLQSKFPNAGKFIVSSCTEDNDIMSMFGNIFGGGDSNPFNNFK